MSSPSTNENPLVFTQQHDNGSGQYEINSFVSSLLVIQEYMKSITSRMDGIDQSLSTLNDRVSKIKTVQNYPDSHVINHGIFSLTENAVTRYVLTHPNIFKGAMVIFLISVASLASFKYIHR